ncbi:MCP four helix bundle domain-containing protein [Marivirga sp.]|uniref:MCP four helix bundle domain-containing protein n=1 Tax=Marivirga sp. TaxID=2018662 RepID=UPI002D80DD0E|nr:MCP four helix bundle domain-containing protein [Marivirga sp.]HET8858729.1 MCP four helix bundle domain-containing protein [Marivirga sp.]
MRLYDKIKWILGILMIISLVITTNLVDRNNFLRINAAIETIYEDRLVVKDLILKISNHIHQKEIAAIRSDSNFYSIQNAQINNDIENYILSYDQTKLTSKEGKILDELKTNLVELREKESEFVESAYSQKTALLSQFPDIRKNLDALARIQLNEGGRQLEISRKAMDTVDLFTEIEIYVLIFLAIVIQIIVMYNPKRE